MLYNLSIIGGSDGKLIILIFIIPPVNIININLISYFFMFFSVLFILFFVFNLISNKYLKNVNAFIIQFNSNLKYSYYEKLFVEIFYTFLDYSKVIDSKEDKFQCKSVFLIYNFTKKKIQLLVQFRPPLVIIIILAYLWANLIINIS